MSLLTGTAVRSIGSFLPGGIALRSKAWFLQ